MLFEELAPSKDRQLQDLRANSQGTWDQVQRHADQRGGLNPLPSRESR